VRRSEQDRDPLLASEPAQQRHEQAQLADAGIAGDQLGEAADRPTTAGQLGVQAANPVGSAARRPGRPVGRTPRRAARRAAAWAGSRRTGR
jgi:hypothetical protein